MDIEEINKQVEEEIKNNKSNKQFLMIKDIYCIEGLNLTPSLACFYSFLVFNSLCSCQCLITHFKSFTVSYSVWKIKLILLEI